MNEVEEVHEVRHGIAKLMHSKRFWTTLGTLISLVANEVFSANVQPEFIVMLGGILIGGYSVQDAVAEHAKGKNGDNS